MTYDENKEVVTCPFCGSYDVEANPCGDDNAYSKYYCWECDSDFNGDEEASCQ
jgi:transposase-like protein